MNKQEHTEVVDTLTLTNIDLQL